MKNFLSKIFYIVFCPLIFSCSPIPLEMGKIENLKIEEVTTQSVSFFIDIPITNNSIFPFTIEGGDLTAFFEDEKIGNAEILETIHIASMKTKTYPIHLKIFLDNPEVSAHMAINALLGKKNTYHIRGTIHAKSIIGKKKIIIYKCIVK